MPGGNGRHLPPGSDPNSAGPGLEFNPGNPNGEGEQKHDHYHEIDKNGNRVNNKHPRLGDPNPIPVAEPVIDDEGSQQAQPANFHSTPRHHELYFFLAAGAVAALLVLAIVSTGGLGAPAAIGLAGASLGLLGLGGGLVVSRRGQG